MKKNYRGFRVYTEFIDTYKSKITVQESSSACYERCWIFINNDGKHPESNLVTDGAAHLSKQQAKWLVKALQKFIDS